MPAAKPVRSIEAVMASLKKKGREKTRAIYSRHGMPAERTLGVSVAELKTVAKSIKGDQALAYQLYDAGLMEAMYLAGMVADGSQMTREQLEKWCEGAVGLSMISEYTVPWKIRTLAIWPCNGSNPVRNTSRPPAGVRIPDCWLLDRTTLWT